MTRGTLSRTWARRIRTPNSAVYLWVGWVGGWPTRTQPTTIPGTLGEMRGIQRGCEEQGGEWLDCSVAGCSRSFEGGPKLLAPAFRSNKSRHRDPQGWQQPGEQRFSTSRVSFGGLENHTKSAENLLSRPIFRALALEPRVAQQNACCDPFSIADLLEKSYLN